MAADVLDDVLPKWHHFQRPISSPVARPVKWFNADKGFGFVACEDGEKDVFVHVSIVQRAGLHVLHEAQRVAMKVVRTQKGREAVSLTLLA